MTATTRMDSMKEKLGLVHVYTGEGKGKTTAAMGLILRASGRGLRVTLLQFMKGRPTGELQALERLEGVQVYRAKEMTKFSFQMTETEKRQCGSVMTSSCGMSSAGAGQTVRTCSSWTKPWAPWPQACWMKASCWISWIIDQPTWKWS